MRNKKIEMEEKLLKKSSRKRRIVAYVIDHFVMMFLIAFFVLISLGTKSFDEGKLETSFFVIGLMVFFIGFLIYFSKDSIRGISIGKWVMGIMIRDENNYNSVPSYSRLLIRNLFMIVWPIEFIVFATNDEKKRLGDKSQKTVVLKNPSKSKTLSRILTLVALGLIFFMSFFLFVGKIMKSSDAYKVSIESIEKNQEIIREVGGIKNYGFMPTGNISTNNGRGNANLQIKVIGSKKTLYISTHLEKTSNGEWILIELNKD